MKLVCSFLVSLAAVLAAAAPAGARIPEPAGLEPLPLGSRVVDPQALPGAWRLESLRALARTRPGVVAGLDEHLRSGPGRVVSVVVQCSSERAARNQLRAWHGSTPMTGSATAVSFADGDFAYLLLSEWTAPEGPHLTRTQLRAAAVALHQHVHGHPAGGL